MGRILRDFKKNDVGVVACVPKILEYVYISALRKARNKGRLSYNIFNLKVKTAAALRGREKFYTPLRIIDTFQDNGIVDKLRGLLYSKAKSQMGENFSFFICGGSLLPKDLDTFFRAAGIEIREGYGLTETSPVISLRRKNGNDYHTAGLPLEGIEVEVRDSDTDSKCKPGNACAI